MTQDEARELSRLIGEQYGAGTPSLDGVKMLLSHIKNLQGEVKNLKDDRREITLALCEHFDPGLCLVTPQIELVKILLDEWKQARETLRDRLAQAALMGLLAAENCASDAYHQADIALSRRDPGESEDE